MILKTLLRAEGLQSWSTMHRDHRERKDEEGLEERHGCVRSGTEKPEMSNLLGG